MTVCLSRSVACRCVSAWSPSLLNSVCLMHGYLHSNCDNTTDTRRDRMFRHISMLISVNIVHLPPVPWRFILIIFFFFYNVHVITTVLHQWPPCLWCRGVPCHPPLQWELCQLVFLWRLEGRAHVAVMARHVRKTPRPPMVRKSQAKKGSYMNTSRVCLPALFPGPH